MRTILLAAFVLLTVGCNHLQMRPLDYQKPESGEAIVAVFDDHFDEVRRCMKQVWVSTKDQGDVVMTYGLVIGPVGMAKDVYVREAKGTAKDSELATCVGAAMKSWQYSPSVTDPSPVIYFPVHLNFRHDSVL